MPQEYLQLDPKDNVAVALSHLEPETEISLMGKKIALKENIRQKHKFSLNDLAVSDAVYMYGVLVGRATKPIQAGTAITIENLKHAASAYREKKQNYLWQPPDIKKFENLTFDGYHRADGRVGTANYWLVIPLVFCENRNVDVIEEAMTEALGYPTKKDFSVDIHALIQKYRDGADENEILNTPIVHQGSADRKNRVFPNVDGIKFLRHNGGCGGTRQDAQVLCNLLAGYITHPNVAGATVLSLGCQNAQMEMLQHSIAAISPNFSKSVQYLEQQQSKSERQFIEEAVKVTFIGMAEANKIERKPAPLSKLTLGLECGGSDGFSGISANPALGYTSDLLVALGGSAVLSEFPELNGVEQELINRCETQEAAEKFSDLMKTYSNAAVAVGSGFENNPSPGNIKDGLITDAMKSAGAAKKGGTSPITAILDYTEQVTKPGLNLLCTPGNDVESTTGLAGSGCTIIVFTTGLGTPTGNPITPVIKMSSNSELFNKMRDIIDLDAGEIINGGQTIESIGEELLKYIIAMASGKEITCADRNGNNDFIPWKRGISL